MAQVRIGTLTLPAQEARHAVRSLRLRPGDPVTVFDGHGHEGHGVLRLSTARSVVVEVKERLDRPFDLPVRITLATAMPKPARQSFLVEKCTELGAAALWPLRCDRCVADPGRAATARWRRTTIEAAKQCGAAWLPEIEEGQGIAEVLQRLGGFDAAMWATTQDQGQSLRDWLATRSSLSTLLVFVGPEGGWSDAERSLLSRSQAAPVSLGPRILRMETACIAALAGVVLCSPGKSP